MSSNKFRSPTNTLYTKGLFYETTLADKSTVVYTLKDWDHPVEQPSGETIVYPSLYKLYLQCNDPTEYSFATQCLDGLYHWETLQECSWFKPYIDRWRRELELRMKSQALSRVMSEAKSTSKNALAANKYLLERGWEPKEGQGARRGRPSKEEIKQAASEAAKASETLSEDYQRILSSKEVLQAHWVFKRI